MAFTEQFGPNAKVIFAQHKRKKQRGRKRRGNQEDDSEWPEDLEAQPGGVLLDEMVENTGMEKASDDVEGGAPTGEGDVAKTEQVDVHKCEGEATATPTLQSEGEGVQSNSSTEKPTEGTEAPREKESTEQPQQVEQQQPSGEQQKKKKKRKNRKKKKKSAAGGTTETTTTTTASTEGQPPQQQLPKDRDWGAWITPENIACFSNTEVLATEEEVKVACITVDYSMQNVLLQMGLQLLSVDGLLIKRLNQYLNRCSACFK